MMEEAESCELEMIYFNVKTNDQLSLYLNDSTYVCYDLKDDTLKRISTKIQEKQEGKVICYHIVYELTLKNIFEQAAAGTQDQKNERVTVIREFDN